MNKKIRQSELFNNEEAYKQAIILLKECRTGYGFVASVTKKHNYYRIFSRDGIIMGLSALLTGKEELIKEFYNTLITLKKHQGKYGQIPSNLDYKKKLVSYGQTAGRVDATLWFVIGCAQYYRYTKDDDFLKKVLPSLKKCVWLLGGWEYNQKGFVFVPPTGDWADEYIQQGYVLYDQLLYFFALREYSYLLRAKGEDNKLYLRKARRLKLLIRANFWLSGSDSKESNIYHPVLYKKGKANKLSKKNYWLPFFSPLGYGYYFDALANILASLFGLADKRQTNRVDKFIASQFAQKTNYLLPAFHPIIKPGDKRWIELTTAFSHKFKNKPYEYHNGGLWPVLTSFYAVDLAKRGKVKLASKYLGGVNQSNFKADKKGGEWEFNEFLHGKTFRSLGTPRQGWSAAATIIAHHAVKGGRNIFR